MKSASAYRPVLFLLLVLCSTGLALRCFQCPWTRNKCEKYEECGAGKDSCMTAIKEDGSLLRQCVAYKRCTPPSVKIDNGITVNFKLRCCQDDFCNNKGFVGLPASGLILFLAAALLVCFS